MANMRAPVWCVFVGLTLTTAACSSATSSSVEATEPAAVTTLETELECPPKGPPPIPSAGFEVLLPDGRVGHNSLNAPQGGESNDWVIPVEVGAPVELLVTVEVYEDVMLESLRFMVRSEKESNWGVEVWSVDVGEHLASGLHKFSIAWDGRTSSGDPIAGMHHLFAGATIESDHRDPCDGDHSGAHEGWGLGYLDVVDP